MTGVDYFAGERFIHDDLGRRAARIAAAVRERWNNTHQAEAYAVTWPDATVKSDDGKDIQQAVVCRLPSDFTEAQRLDTIRKMVERTKAYGLVLVLPKAEAIHVLFETHHGARAWLMRLERHGDVSVCLPPIVRADAECVGLLWRPARGTS